MRTQDAICVTPVRGGVEPLNDVALLAAFGRGDVRAFEILFNRHHGRLHAVGVRILGDAAEADDVVQETFLSLLRIADQVDEEFKLMAWLHRVATNRCLTLLRTRRRVYLVSGDETWMRDARDEQRSGQPAEAYDMAQARDRVAEVARSLPAQQRAAFLLREIEGLPYEAIAERLGVSHGAVESLLFRARRRFKREYLRLEGEEPATAATTRKPVEVVGRARISPWEAA